MSGIHQILADQNTMSADSTPCWWSNGYTFKNEKGIHVLMNDESWRKITDQEYRYLVGEDNITYMMDKAANEHIENNKPIWRK